MTFENTGTMLAMLTTVYTTRLMPHIDDAAIRVWAQLLADLDWKRVQAATAAWITKEHYPPTIADIRELVTTAALPEVDPPELAWKQINTAVQKFGYNKPTEAQAFLGEQIWRAVDRFGWMHFCEMDDREGMANYAQFRDAYTTGIKRERERAQIPEAVREAISGIGNNPGRIEGVST